MKASVLAVCGDAGGAAAVAPVVARLHSDVALDVRSAVYRQARQLWARLGLEHELFPENVSEEELARLASGSDVLLLGTSVNGLDFERRMTALRPEHSVTILDFWSNYAERFRSPEGNLVLPAAICVMDEQAKAEMMAEGFDGCRLIVTGQPAFDELARIRAGFLPEHARALRASCGVGEDDVFVVFASQPLAELYGRPGLRERHPGYDQHQVLRLLVDTLESLAKKMNKGICLLVRPHPGEDTHTLGWADAHTGFLRVRVGGEGDSRSYAMAADLMCGMTSMVLVEACYLGCLTLSVQPRLAGPDILPTNRKGWSVLVREPDGLPCMLEVLLMDRKARERQKAKLSAAQLDGRAAQRVAEVVYRMISKRKEG